MRRSRASVEADNETGVGMGLMRFWSHIRMAFGTRMCACLLWACLSKPRICFAGGPQTFTTRPDDRLALPFTRNITHPYNNGPYVSVSRHDAQSISHTRGNETDPPTPIGRVSNFARGEAFATSTLPPCFTWRSAKRGSREATRRVELAMIPPPTSRGL